MGRLLLIFVALIVGFSLTTGSVAHSREPVTCVTSSSVENFWHSSRDTDQIPSDTEKGYAHYHGGCHGHQICDAVRDCVLDLGRNSAGPVGGPRLMFVPASPADPSLRPPIA